MASKVVSYPFIIIIKWQLRVSAKKRLRRVTVQSNVCCGEVIVVAVQLKSYTREKPVNNPVPSQTGCEAKQVVSQGMELVARIKEFSIPS